MKLVEVTDKTTRQEFLEVPKILYKNDPNWTCPLDMEIENIFNPDRNSCFKNGDAIRWILKDDNGSLTGRIAAFYDKNKAYENTQPTGGTGFFECIRNQEAANILFDAAREWLRSHGMEAMDGPINFGENFVYWGLLIDGFIKQAYGMPYNFPYYRSIFEGYGFKNYFEQYTYHRMAREPDGKIVQFPDRIMKIAEWLSRRPGYSFRHFTFREKDKFLNDLVDIYNAAWAVYKEDFTPLDPAFINETFKKAKAIIDEDIIWFAYYNDKPIAFFVLYPDLNQILENFNGKLHLWNKIRFMYYKVTHKMTRMRAFVGGVTPLYQNSGVESAIFYHLYQVFKKKPWYKELELSWVGDYNPKMIAIYEALGAQRAKKHVTYRYIFNEKLPFRRYKNEMNQRQKADRPGESHK